MIADAIVVFLSLKRDYYWVRFLSIFVIRMVGNLFSLRLRLFFLFFGLWLEPGEHSSGGLRRLL
jgi:hypothetical protein